MQPRSEEFRAHAAECEEIAKRCGGLIKEHYVQLAGQWLFLARQAEKIDRSRSLIVRDAVFLCAAPRPHRAVGHSSDTRGDRTVWLGI
jgi:hypothetical protein